jgi:hypothetical protein
MSQADETAWQSKRGTNYRSQLVKMEPTLRPGSRKQAFDTCGAICPPIDTRDGDRDTRVVATTRQMGAHPASKPAPTCQPCGVSNRTAQPKLDITKLVFLDESGASTNTARHCERGPRGERCIASVPLTAIGTPPPSSRGFVIMTSPFQ